MNTMMAGRQSTSSDAPEGLTIIIPAERKLFAMLFLAVWLIGWACGEVSALRQLFGGDGGPGLFLAVWLVGWTIGGVWATYSFLWFVMGKEIVSLGSGSLAIKYEVVGVGRTFRYDLGGVRHLRVLPYSGKTVGRMSAFAPLGSGIGAVAFDYDTEVVRFAAVGELEARQIIAQLKTRYAFVDGAA